jgi:succinoglycan biosynthesis protein ExoM
VINNGSDEYAHQLGIIIEESNIRTACHCSLIQSTQNNISAGRNCVLQHAQHAYLAFIDDDEYPDRNWLCALVDAVRGFACDMVAGPILPVYEGRIPAWVQSVDVHNTLDKYDGMQIDYAAAGNCLLSRHRTTNVQFDLALGKSGGEDTDYFLRMKDEGMVLRWCSQAIVHEDIPSHRASSRNMIERFMSQGHTYRRILENRGELENRTHFLIRASIIAIGSLTVAGVFMMVRPRKAAPWMKRGFSNLGKLSTPARHLYD